MDVYVDPSALEKTRRVGDCIRDLLPSQKIVKLFQARARCSKIVWAHRDSYYDPCELISKIYCMREEAKNNPNADFSRLSKSEQRDMAALAQTLAVGFRRQELNEKPVEHASRTASLVWRITKSPQKTIEDYTSNRQVVLVSDWNDFNDNAVCRVLYCNHPEVPDNSNKKGYESQSHNDKHFLDSGDGSNVWIAATNVINKRFCEKVSKFKPGITFDSSDYKDIERSAILDAMRRGRYSLQRIKGSVCEYKGMEYVGASLGEKTNRVCVDTCNDYVHAYPVPMSEKDRNQ